MPNVSNSNPYTSANRNGKRTHVTAKVYHEEVCHAGRKGSIEHTTPGSHTYNINLLQPTQTYKLSTYKKCNTLASRFYPATANTNFDPRVYSAPPPLPLCALPQRDAWSMTKRQRRATHEAPCPSLPIPSTEQYVLYLQTQPDRLGLLSPGSDSESETATLASASFSFQYQLNANTDDSHYMRRAVFFSNTASKGRQDNVGTGGDTTIRF